MSKKFRGKTCVYCGRVDAAYTADHVVCREFFPVQARDNLPKVPACAECNNEKSRLEHYLTTVMPFGGTQSSASTMLTELVPKRLAGNGKLQSALSAGFGYRYISRNGGPWQRQAEVPFDGHQLNRLFALVVRGLAFHHWGLIFDQNHALNASFVSEIARSQFEKLLAMNATRVSANLGNGVFVYEGVQANNEPHLTAWRMSLYGAEVIANATRPSERLRWAYGLTAPRSWPVTSKFMQLLDAP